MTVTVTIGTTALTATSAAATDHDGDAATPDQSRWSVDVPPAASYITGASVQVTVAAEKAGFTAPANETRTLAVDQSGPTAPSYTAPASLKVGVALAAVLPSGGSDIAANGGYSAAGLPSGLTIDEDTGAISGTPDAARTSTSSVTVTVTDAAGNPATVSLTFPLVTKGDQDLSGFAYSANSVTFGSAGADGDGAERWPRARR